MKGKNPVLLGLGVLAGIAGVIIIATFPFNITSARIINSALNGAVGGSLIGLCLVLVQQKKKGV